MKIFDKNTFSFKKLFKNEDFFNVFWSFSIAIFLTVLIRSLLFDPFHVPSGSMVPSLLPGDKMFVSKFSFGYSKYSFPFRVIPIKKKIFSKIPQRGDIVVFALPTNDKIFYVKRVVGLPGDKIMVVNGEVFVNNVKLQRNLIQTDTQLNVDKITSAKYNIKESVYGPSELYQERTSDGKSYYTINSTAGMPDVDNAGPFNVPSDSVFVMGDNRNNSVDSRFKEVGFIPLENIIGKPLFVFFSSDGNFLTNISHPSKVRYSRFFTSLTKNV